MMNIVSIDPAKGKTGVFCKFNGKDHSFVIKTKQSMNHGECLVYIFNSISDLLYEHNYTFGLIEGYALNFKYPRSSIKFCEVGGVIRMVFARLDVPLITIPVQTWKNITGIKIKKNEHKKEYLDAIEHKFGKRFESIDIADAYLIYKTAQILAGRTKWLTAGMIEIRNQLKAAIEKE